MSRFLRTPDKMDKYVKKEMPDVIQKNLPVKGVDKKVPSREGDNQCVVERSG